jgi:hypothetical protein
MNLRRRQPAQSRSTFFTVLSWLLSLVSTVVGVGSSANAQSQLAEADAANARRNQDAFASPSLGSAAGLEEFRALAVRAASFVEQHPHQDALLEHLVPLKAKADELFARHAITLRKIEIAIVDPSALARTPGFVSGAYRDLKFVCMLADSPFDALRDMTWLTQHRENLERLLRHLPHMEEDELLAAEPITDFASPEFSARLGALNGRRA